MADAKSRWYYDACALDQRNTYYEITNKNPPKEAVISHLALGEAHGNSHSKGSKVADAFIQLIESLRGLIKIVGNDGVESEYESINDIFPYNKFSKFTITDRIHLATALKHGCTLFVTTDQFLIKSLPKKKLEELCRRCNCCECAIVEAKDRT